VAGELSCGMHVAGRERDRIATDRVAASR
jgi:hypothetical protein